MDLKFFYLEDLLGRPVDLVTDKRLRRELKPAASAGSCARRMPG
jgi:predicted nucleotidyltransferase